MHLSIHISVKSNNKVLTPSSAMFNQLMITILKEASDNWKKLLVVFFLSLGIYGTKICFIVFYCTFLRFQNGKKGDKITKIFYFFPCWAFFSTVFKRFETPKSYGFKTLKLQSFETATMPHYLFQKLRILVVLKRQ